MQITGFDAIVVTLLIVFGFHAMWVAFWITLALALLVLVIATVA